MAIYFIDTNIFLRFFTKDDEGKFGDCVNLIKNIKQNKLKAVSSSLVLAEVTWTLLSYYKFPKLKVAKALRSIVNLRGLNLVDKYQPKIAVQLFGKHSVKFIDALIGSTSEIMNEKWIVVSYDKDFDKLGVKRKEPDAIKAGKNTTPISNEDISRRESERGTSPGFKIKLLEG